jgi:hypothetical protein
VRVPVVDLRRHLERRVHPEQADADVDHVHVLGGDPEWKLSPGVLFPVP